MSSLLSRARGDDAANNEEEVHPHFPDVAREEQGAHNDDLIKKKLFEIGAFLNRHPRQATMQSTRVKKEPLL